MCVKCNKTTLSKGKSSSPKPTVYRGSQTRVAGTGFGKSSVKISFGSKKR